MPVLPHEDCALALARLDGVLERLKLLEKEGHQEDWQACYHRAISSEDTSPCDVRDFKLLNNIFGTTNGRKVAAWREDALKRGESCAEIAEVGYHADGEDAEDRQLAANRQLAVATENGFTFPLICNILFHDVGVDPDKFIHRGEGGDSSKIPRFLNRVLGMRLSCQQAMTQLFYETLSSVVKEAKRRGAYDLGIRNYSGREVRFEVSVCSVCVQYNCAETRQD
jgi:hypothetical protein